MSGDTDVIQQLQRQQFKLMTTCYEHAKSIRELESNAADLDTRDNKLLK